MFSKIKAGISMSVLLLSATSAHAVPLSLSSEIYLTNIHITNLNSLAITSKNIDYNVNNTSARAVASDSMSSLNNARIAYRGSVDDTSTSGSAYSFSNSRCRSNSLKKGVFPEIVS